MALWACSFFSTKPDQPIPTPIPTSSIPGLQVVSPQACQVAEQGMIRTEYPQGDLISWSPQTNTVAYVASTRASSWNVGDLNLLVAPKFDAPDRIASRVAGELTWSPDGSSIAYLSLRSSDNLYTIGLAYTDKRVSNDLFPGEAARSDGYSSQKAILEWVDQSRLRVFTSCGSNCLQGLDITIPDGRISSTGDSIVRIRDLWAAHTYHPAQVPAALAGLVGQLNWSPDESKIAYINEQGDVWIINETSDSQYPLEIGSYGTATETDWSHDSQYLAVQVDRNLKIFSFECP